MLTTYCFTCAFEASGTRDARDAAHLRFDGAHEPNWIVSDTDEFERDITPESDDDDDAALLAGVDRALAAGTMITLDEFRTL